MGGDKTDYGLEIDFFKLLGCKLIECADLLVKGLTEIDKENKFITKNYIRHLYGDDTQFNYGIFKNGNGKYILAYHRKHLRDISGIVEFDDTIEFLERMRAMKIKEQRIRAVALVSDDEQD